MAKAYVLNQLSLKPYRIFLVDDEPDIIMILSDFFKDVLPNCKLVTANSGSEAARKFLNQHFDLIITDLNMPHGNGENFLKTVEQMPTHTRPKYILILSAHIDPNTPVNTGLPVAYMSKPFKSDILMDYLNKTILKPVEEKKTITPVDTNFINAYIQATAHVFKILVGVDIVKEKVFIRGPKDINGDISAISVISGQIYVGAMAISFPQDTFLKIVNKLLMAQYTDINDENKDAASELCNQIYGTAKVNLNKEGNEITSAIPSLITGPGHTINHQFKGTCVAVNFTCPYGPFSIEAIIQNRQTT